MLKRKWQYTILLFKIKVTLHSLAKCSTHKPERNLVLFSSSRFLPSSFRPATCQGTNRKKNRCQAAMNVEIRTKNMLKKTSYLKTHDPVLQLFACCCSDACPFFIAWWRSKMKTHPAIMFTGAHMVLPSKARNCPLGTFMGKFWAACPPSSSESVLGIRNHRLDLINCSTLSFLENQLSLEQVSDWSKHRGAA